MTCLLESILSVLLFKNCHILVLKTWVVLFIQKSYPSRSLKLNLHLLDDEIVFGTKISVNCDKKKVLQYLSIGILVEEKCIVKLHYKNFLRFIGKKSRNNGFLGKFFS